MVDAWESGGDTSINVKGGIEDCFEHFKEYLELHTPSRQCDWRCYSHGGHEVRLDK